MSALAACHNCRFWSNGECRRMPAQVVTVWFEGKTETDSKWPNTLPKEWCGEHQPLPEPKQERGGTHFRKCRGELSSVRTRFRRYDYFVRVPITAEEHDALLTMQEKAPVFLGVELPKAEPI